jgi:hypothetical protein
MLDWFDNRGYKAYMLIKSSGLDCNVDRFIVMARETIMAVRETTYKDVWFFPAHIDPNAVQ